MAFNQKRKKIVATPVWNSQWIIYHYEIRESTISTVSISIQMRAICKLEWPSKIKYLNGNTKSSKWWNEIVYCYESNPWEQEITISRGYSS